jgi:hypothetical protein
MRGGSAFYCWLHRDLCCLFAVWLRGNRNQGRSFTQKVKSITLVPSS